MCVERVECLRFFPTKAAMYMATTTHITQSVDTTITDRWRADSETCWANQVDNGIRSIMVCGAQRYQPNGKGGEQADDQVQNRTATSTSTYTRRRPRSHKRPDRAHYTARDMFLDRGKSIQRDLVSRRLQHTHIQMKPTCPNQQILNK